MGMFNPKGRMHFAFGSPVSLNAREPLSNGELNKQYTELAELIDSQIYANFKLWPGNYIAYDLLMQEARFREKYTAEDKEHFKTMIEQVMIHLDFPIDDIRERFLKIYANPVINKLKVTDKK